MTSGSQHPRNGSFIVLLKHYLPVQTCYCFCGYCLGAHVIIIYLFSEYFSTAPPLPQTPFTYFIHQNSLSLTHNHLTFFLLFCSLLSPCSSKQQEARTAISTTTLPSALLLPISSTLLCRARYANHGADLF